MDFFELNIKEINEGLKNKSFTAKDVSVFFIDRIKEKNEDFFSFLEIDEKRALSQADEVDRMIERKENFSLLSGIPMALKDNIMVKGMKCTAASKMLENYIAPYNATVVEKLREQKSVLLGKTNMDEFAMGSSTEHSAFGITRNPLDSSRVPGGSSGGSAAAVAAGLCSFALGSDTGGSIRQPASFCGIVGLKPTYGAVSRYGLMAMASSLDQIGPLARTVEDVEIIFNAISGKDEKDSTSIDSSYLKSKHNPKKIKIGVPKEYFIKGIDKEVEETVKKAIKEIEREGFEIKETSLPHTEYALATYYIIMASEVSANMSRYDGIKYGLSKSKDQTIKNLSQIYYETRKQGLGSEVKRRIILGNHTLSSGYYDAYYGRAQKVRTLIARDFENAFNEVDLILTPTAPTLPFKIGEKIRNPLSMWLSDIFTVTANLAGLPAVSMPCGSVDGLSVGIQIIGPPFKEEEIFRAGELFEKIWKK